VLIRTPVLGRRMALGIGECYTSAIHEAAEYIIIGGKNKNLSDFANEESELRCGKVILASELG